MSLNSVMLLAAQANESHSEPAINPWIIGGLALGILLLLLFALMAFGAGREHS